MCPRDDKIYDEAAALWRELYTAPPPGELDGGTILRMIMQRLPEAEYGRLTSVHLRPSNIVFPQR
jgi:hypothetical protein